MATDRKQTEKNVEKKEQKSRTEEMIIAIKNLFAFHLNGALHTLTRAQYAYVYYTHTLYTLYLRKKGKRSAHCLLLR